MFKKLTAATIIVSSLVAAYAAFQVLGSEIALFELYPDIDQTIIVKAHRIMVRRVLAGKYKDYDMQDDAVIAPIFLSIVAELTQ